MAIVPISSFGEGFWRWVGVGAAILGSTIAMGHRGGAGGDGGGWFGDGDGGGDGGRE